MISFIRAHGYDPAPTQRPVLCGALSGVIAVIPAAWVFVGFGSFDVAATEVLRLSRLGAAILIVAAFGIGGLLYGALFRRAADDTQAGWVLGMSFGFVLWAAAPVVVLPLIGDGAMAGGRAAIGFLASFLLWGATLGMVFPLLHRRLRARISARSEKKQVGPDVAGSTTSRTPADLHLARTNGMDEAP